MDVDQLISELTFKAVRSSGSGGQHVNKVATKVELYFNIHDSLALSEEEKERLLKTLNKRINKQGVLSLSSDESRSQFRNKDLVIKRCIQIIKEALKSKKKRKPTKVPKAANQKRLQDKRKAAEKKAQRKPPKLN